MTITSILMLAFVASASCLSYSSQSKPFRLFLQSNNATLSGIALAACHQGAAIEGLCITQHRASDPAVEYTMFYHNVSSNTAANAIDTLGVVGWTLKVNGGTLSVPSSLSIQTDLFSDVASPTFQPGESDFGNVAFDANGIMYLSPTLNDLVTPPESFGRPMRLESWYVCLTRYSSYTYWTLNWQVGMNSLRPQNPSCVDVQVKRVFL